jgi:hypothetical protein
MEQQTAQKCPSQDAIVSEATIPHTHHLPVRPISQRATRFLHWGSSGRKNDARVGYEMDMIRLDYVSCILTVLSTVLLGKRLWQGWVIAAMNSVVVCIIGMRTAQFGFVPANLFCIGLYANNLWNWRPKTR